MGIDEQIRQIIRKRGVSGYAIAKAIDVQESVVYRFLQGADVSAATLSKIADFLELELRDREWADRMGRIERIKLFGEQQTNPPIVWKQRLWKQRDEGLRELSLLELDAVANALGSHKTGKQFTTIVVEAISKSRELRRNAD